MSRTPSAFKAALCGFLAALLTFSGPSFALGPFEKNHPEVEEGLEAYEQGDYDKALRHFEAAKKELPQSSAVEFNRGNALHKLGKHQEAVDAYRHAADIDQGELRQQDYYNLGNTYAAMGKRDEALAAYRRSLLLNPSDSLARQNMEIVLRNLPPPQQQKQQGPDGGQSDGGLDGGTPDAGRDGGQPGDGGQDGGRDGGDQGRQDGGRDGGGTDAGRGDGGGGDGGQGDGGAPDGGQPGDGGQKGDGGEGQGEGGGDRADGGSSDAGTESEESEVREEEAGDGGSALPEKISKEEAEKLLDAMKQNERNLQLWRFQKKKPRKPNEKDW